VGTRGEGVEKVSVGMGTTIREGRDKLCKWSGGQFGSKKRVVKGGGVKKMKIGGVKSHEKRGVWKKSMESDM